MIPILPNGWITVLIRDDSPLRNCNDAPRFRSVRLQLTTEQRQALALISTDEVISQCFWEDQR